MDVVIVGASGGIGCGLLEYFAETVSALKILATYRTDQGLARIKECGLRYPLVEIVPCRLDALSAPDLLVFSDHLAGMNPSYVINTIGQLAPVSCAPEKKLEDLQADNLSQIFETNVIAHVNVLKALLPCVRLRKPIVIVSVSAKVGSIQDNRLGGWYSYRMSKTALNMLIKSVSIEFQRLNPKSCVVAIHPGTVDTEFSRAYHKGLPHGQVISAAQSAAQIVSHLRAIDESHTGKFFAFDGVELPW